MDTQANSGGQIFTLLPKVMQAIGHVGKSRKNQQQNYAFRGIDDLYNAVQPALIANGVTVAPHAVEWKSREERATRNGGVLFYTVVICTFRFYAPDGSFVESTTLGEAMDSGDKSCNKAMSAAMKYALMQTLCIPTEESKDTEDETHEPAPLPEPLPPPAAPKPIAPVAKDPMQIAVGALVTKWKKHLNPNASGPNAKTAFVQYAKIAADTDKDLGDAKNWTADFLTRVGAALDQDINEMAGVA
jgi:hypothetical protein